MTKPFLKWPGGKRKLLPRIINKLPKGDRLVEPFVGSGAVFMGTDYGEYLLADNNKDLIDLYIILKNEGDWFVDYVKGLFGLKANTPENYYAIRDEFNTLNGVLGSSDSFKRAAYFVWLNRHCYNGLCRYNASGGFNVPHGKYKSVYFPEDEMRAFAEKLQRARLVHEDFHYTMILTRAGDVVYCDPPYVPLSVSSSFTAYSAGGFDSKQHHRLTVSATRCRDRGVPVVISNHSTTHTRNLYKAAGAHINYFKASRSISAKGSSRKPVTELLARFDMEDAA